MSYEPGQKVGDYEVLEVLGAGGMGEVYKVRNVISDRVEAMKILLPDLAGQQELAGRFLREIKVLAGLEHPNIAALRTAQHVGNQLIMIMELVEGTTLAHRLRAGPFPEREAADFVSQVLFALSYAHGRGIVHRDIKPANMMLTRAGLVKLMDFGIARAAGDNKLTQTGSTLGSIYYMSPEQVQGQNLDARSDLYSLGVSLYELLTGLHPFEGDTGFTIMKGHIEGTFVPPRQVNAAISPALNDIVIRAMAKNPDERFQTADHFKGALDDVRQLLQTSAAPMAAVGLAGEKTTPSRAAIGTPAARPAAASVPPPQLSPDEVPTAPTMAVRAQTQAAPPPAPTPVPAAVPGSAAAMPAAPPATTAPGTTAPASQTVAASAAAAQTSGAIAPPPPSRSYRAFYIGLGSALTVLLIVLTAMKLPVFRGTPADSRPTATTPGPAQPTNTTPGATAAPGVAAPANAPSANPPADNATGGSPGSTGGHAVAAPSGASAAETAAAKRAREEAAAAKKEQEAAAAAAAAAAQAAAEEAARLFDEQENRFVHMAARAAAMKTSYETLRNQQASAGYSPDQTLTKAVSTMEQFLGRAEAALSAHDGASAKKYMDMAEPQIVLLERRFGR